MGTEQDLNSSMKLLVVGGAGYIGINIVFDALERGWEVTVFDDLTTGSKNLSNVKVHQSTTLSILIC